MAEIEGKKKRLSINLSFLSLTESPKQTSPQKSPRNFEEPNGVVGLSILAALNDVHRQDPIFSTSKPIPILSDKKFSKNSSGKKLSAEEIEMELCEEYTCVISHVGGNEIKKTEYFDAGFLGGNNGSKRVSVVIGDRDDSVLDQVQQSRGRETATFVIADFLSSCFLCDKLLHGLDIFMYRGEKGFCSVECRHRQISIDEKKEKRRSRVRKPIEYSVSPCSGTLQFFAGVAAA